MSYATLILGHSGSGKTSSLRNLDPSKVYLIQPTRKPLPFRKEGWKERTRENQSGNIRVAERPSDILRFMRNAQEHYDIIVIDDFQYILANMYMERRDEKGFDRFNDIGGAGFDIAKLASELDPNKRVYVMGHTTTDELGFTKIKTIGKLLDDKVVLEGMFTTVLLSILEDGEYKFRTQNSGRDTVKSPIDMFMTRTIDNDLALVDRTICEYYGIKDTPPQVQQVPVQTNTQTEGFVNV